eukprot:GEMP01048891.1.p2 GENE.GEMP01048891.1~~GEMP01048891.1.p2  ORF type:complete len:119 (+),score=32.71 GEMP01048891.1:236-592(+)
MVLHFADLFHDLASFCSPADHHASSFVDPKVQAARRAANKDVTDLNKLKEATKGELEERMAQAQENKKTLKNLADNTVRVAQMIRDKVDGFEKRPLLAARRTSCPMLSTTTPVQHGWI